jgi:UDP-N-acetylglucosamine transferase subunit ALG13
VIFVTVGSMLPFDRLIRLMDAWSLANPAHEVFAQLGEGSYKPRNFHWERMLSPVAFTSAVRSAKIVVGHAGTGSVFTAGRFGKPIVLVPRRVAQREMTTDHQVHTARWLESSRGIYVVWDDHLLDRQINAALESREHAETGVSPFAPAEFTQRIRAYILDGKIAG